METQIKIHKIEERTSKVGKTYVHMETSQGMMNCHEPAQYDKLRQAEGGLCTVDVLERNGFKNVTRVVSVDAVGESVAPSKPQSSPSPSMVSSDDKRQRLIVRQSCLKAAIELAVSQSVDSTEGMMKLAEEFEAWVFR